MTAPNCANPMTAPRYMRKAPKRTPLNGQVHLIAEGAWFYDEAKGILVVTELRRNGVYIGTAKCRIPWAMLKAAVTRKAKSVHKP